MAGKRNVWEYKFAKCPFFVGLGEKSGERHIACEGIIKDTTIHIVFSAPGGRDKVFKGVCCATRGYTQCPYYKLNYEEYTEDE